MDRAGSSKREQKAHLLKDALELVKIKQPDGSSRYTIKPLEAELSFDKGFYVFIRAIQLLTQHNKDTTVVGLAGPSGSGKTAFSEKIKAFIPGCALLSMDNYNDGSKVIDGNFDDPRITDYETLLQNIADLKAGRPTQVPIYDFKESRRVGYQTLEVPESRVVILEGIYALNTRLRPMLDLRVSITGGVHFDLVKRVLRDIDRSGQAPEEIIQQISDTVYPMYKAFIEPDLKAAHLRVLNTFNPFSGFMSPTYILKSGKPISVDTALQVLDEGSRELKQLSETYDIYLLPPGEDPETCQSWLRMRCRDGRYSLMFEEWVVENDFIISPRVTFEVPVRILGGLMALGYEIGTIMQRTTEMYEDERLTVKFDRIEGMDRVFIQLQGKDREYVAAAARQLGLDGTYIPHSYIELVQIENLTTSFQTVTEDLKRRFAVNGEPLIDESVVGSYSRGSSPHLSSSGFLSQLARGERSADGGGGSHHGGTAAAYARTTGFALPTRPTMASSAPARPVTVPRVASSGRVNGLLSRRMLEAKGEEEQTPYMNGHHGADSGGRPSPTVGSCAYGGHTTLGVAEMAAAAAAVAGIVERGGGGSRPRSGGSTPPEDIPGARERQRGGGGGGNHHARNGSRGGGSRPGSRDRSKPGTPTGLEAQVAKLVVSQQVLSNQLEELALQLSLSQIPGSQRYKDVQAAAAAAEAAATGGAAGGWVVPLGAGWAAAGVALGAVATLLLQRLS